MLSQDGLAAASSRDAKIAREMAHATAEKKKRKALTSTSALRARLELSCLDANTKFHLCGLLAAEVATQCRRAIDKHGMMLEANPKEAIVYVVDNPAAPESQELALLACMQGGYMVTPEWLCSRGRQGLAAAVVQATHTRRKLWVSSAFKTNYPQLAATLASTVESGDSKWRLCKRADWLNAAVKATPPWSTIALVTSAEMAALGVRTALDPASFLAKYFRLDATHCTMRA